MEGDAPRILMRGLQQATRSSPRHAQTTSSSTSRMLSNRSSTTAFQPVSSEKVSSSIKRPAQDLLTSSAKKRKSLTSTATDIITPRTNIRAYLQTADTNTPAPPSETRRLHGRLSRSAMSSGEVPNLIANESSSRRTSARKKQLSKSYPTPGESITPREAIRMYLRTAETEPRSRESMPSKQTEEANESDSNEEIGENDELQDDDKGMESEDKQVESGNVENLEKNDVEPKTKVSYSAAGESSAESQDEAGKIDKADASLERQQKKKYKSLHDRQTEKKGSYDFSQEAIAESSLSEQSSGEQEFTNSWEKSSPRKVKQNVSQQQTIYQDDDIQDNLADDENLGEILHETVSGIRNKSAVLTGQRSLEWTELQTPRLPDSTTVKATPVIFDKPHISSQQKKPGNVRKLSGKQGQAKRTKTPKRSSSVVRFPASLVDGIFCHFSSLRVSKDALDAVQVGSEAFFEHLAMDLTSYCNHARRKTIEGSDVELLMRRQGLVKSRESFHALIEKYLPMEYRAEVIPTAKSGNEVVPKQRI